MQMKNPGFNDRDFFCQTGLLLQMYAAVNGFSVVFITNKGDFTLDA
jgi:hypothetical protein